MKRIWLAGILLTAAGCASGGGGSPASSPGRVSTAASDTALNPFPSTYAAFPSRPTLIRGGTVMTAAGQVIPNGQLLLVEGKIAAVGPTNTRLASAQACANSAFSDKKP